MPGKDGDQIELKPDLLKKSLNFDMIGSGQAYPLFYTSLFADLREVFSTAAARARSSGIGLWAKDVTNSGVDGSTIAKLEQNGVIFPKLFRRLTEFLAHGGKISAFMAWLQAKNEPVWDLSTSNRTHFDTYVSVSGNIVKLTKAPELLAFIEATTRKAAWL